MIKALQYGDVRGWGEGWENSLDDNGDDAYERINEAIHAVAADLLKKDSVPIARKTTKASNGKGYLMFVILAVIVICVWYISRSF